MSGNQERLRYDRVAHHASIWRGKARPSRLEIGATSFDAEASSSTTYNLQTVRDELWHA